MKLLLKAAKGVQISISNIHLCFSHNSIFYNKKNLKKGRSDQVNYIKLSLQVKIDIERISNNNFSPHLKYISKSGVVSGSLTTDQSELSILLTLSSKQTVLLPTRANCYVFSCSTLAVCNHSPFKVLLVSPGLELTALLFLHH